MRLKYPSVYKGVINSIRRKANRNNVKLYFGIGKTVHTDDLDIEGSAGFFYETKPAILAVAIGKEHPDDWIKVLLHESCHMDQFLDKKISKETKAWWEKCVSEFFEWMDGTRQLNKKQVYKLIQGVIDCERDCEERTVAKIKKWNLPISIIKYTQAANVYFYSYYVVAQTRQWFNGIYNHREIYELAPKKFLKSYKRIPEVLELAIISVSTETQAA